jgi:hypothetical protein
VLLTICLHMSDRKIYSGFGCTFDRHKFQIAWAPHLCKALFRSCA